MHGACLNIIMCDSKLVLYWQLLVTIITKMDYCEYVESFEIKLLQY